MIEESRYIPKQGVMTAVCRYNKDIPLLEIGKSYNVDYVIIAPSRSMVCLSQLPGQVFGAGFFTFYINEEKIHIIWDYRALKRILNDTYRDMICRDLSEDRIAQIKKSIIIYEL